MVLAERSVFNKC